MGEEGPPISGDSASVSHGPIIGTSQPLRDILALIDKAARTDLPVLIVGETGTGKELVASEIHAQGSRNGKPFVAVNTGALPKELVASELFGHRRGAFTGATEDRLGRFREADGGTLFLDEIGTMDDVVQVALLRVLENETFRPVGESDDQQVNVRLIAAANVDPRELAARGEFREDLLYRFEVMRIDLPPLRDIISDVPLLVAHYLGMFSERYEAKIDGLSSAALQALISYAWPGNIRELKNIVAQACVVVGSGTIGLEHLPARIISETGSPNAGDRTATRENGTHAGVGPNPTFGAGEPVGATAPGSTDGVFMPIGASLDDVQRMYVLKTLEFCNQNKTQAAKVLGVSRKTLYDRLERWGCR